MELQQEAFTVCMDPPLWWEDGAPSPSSGALGCSVNMQRAKRNGPGCRKRLKVKTKRYIYFQFDLLYSPVMEVYSRALRKIGSK